MDIMGAPGMLGMIYFDALQARSTARIRVALLALRRRRHLPMPVVSRIAQLVRALDF